MKQFAAVLVTTLFLIVLAGCGSIENMIEKATEREVTFYNTILDSEKDGDVKAVLVAHNLDARLGHIAATGEKEVSDLTDQIEVARLGIGEVCFYVKGRLINQGHLAATVRLFVAPGASADNLPAVEIGSVTLRGIEDYTLEKPGDMDQDAADVHERLSEVFFSLDDRYLVNPVIVAQGNGEDGVYIEHLELAAVPVLWRTRALETSALSGYSENIRELKEATLEGSITNNGTDLAEVRLYLSRNADEVGELVAQGYVQPGQTLHGYELLAEGGEGQIKKAMKSMIEGDGVRSDFIVVTSNPMLVSGDRFRLQATVIVGLDVF